METIVEPTLVADARGLPIWFQPLDGPVTAALTFRVGVGDEPLVRRGFTHMIQHLALSDINDPLIEWDGFVDLNRTVFHATGPQHNVEQFMRNVVQNLGDLPLDRLPSERDVLAAESRRRGHTLAGELFSRRWGAQGWGTCAWWEMAVGSADADLLDHWRRASFSRANATLWMTGEPSPDFALALPDGHRMTTPVADDIVSGRAWFRHETNAVAFMVRAPRSHAASVGAQVIVANMERELRTRGLCSTVDSAWHRLDLRRAALVVTCETLPQREAELARAIVELLDDLARDVPSELIDEVRERRDAASTDDQARRHLDAWSLDLLLGRARTTAAAERAAEANVARANVRHEIDQMNRDLLLMVPPIVTIAAVDLPPYPALAAPPVEGRRHAYATLADAGDGKSALTVGPTGLALETPVVRTTVMWSHIAAVMRWQDGTRIVVDGRGQSIVVEPTRLEHGAEAIAEIDANTPANLAVRVGPRYATPVLPSASERTLKILDQVRTAITAALGLAIALGALLSRHHPVLGWPMVALGLVGMPWFAIISTRRPRPTVWDNANRRTNVPAHVDRDSWYIPGGMLLGWAAARGHLVKPWTIEFHADLKAFKSKDITGPELYRRLGGVLADDLLDDDANEFFADYLGQRNRGYDVDLGRAVDSDRYFEIADTWQMQAAVIKAVEASFKKWRRFGHRRVTRHLRRAGRLGGGPGAWRGPQSNEWAERVVQRRRRRRWSAVTPISTATPDRDR
ncbi:MAG: putative zinc protease [Ilumatobacteraceae bacterium]|nr:putative zinc protease [Ilumatobacteraceae bacterium]